MDKQIKDQIEKIRNIIQLKVVAVKGFYDDKSYWIADQETLEKEINELYKLTNQKEEYIMSEILNQDNPVIVYDITLQSGQQIKNCYFVEYQRPVSNGFGCLLTYAYDCIKCFDQNDEEIKEICLDGAIVNKIYNINTGKDYTDIFSKKVTEIEDKLGYKIYCPYIRKIVILN